MKTKSYFCFFSNEKSESLSFGETIGYYKTSSTSRISFHDPRNGIIWSFVKVLNTYGPLVKIAPEQKIGARDFGTLIIIYLWIFPEIFAAFP